MSIIPAYEEQYKERINIFMYDRTYLRNSM